MKIMKILSFNSPFGWITIEEKNKQIQSIKFGKNKNLGKSLQLQSLKKQITQYFLGKKKKFTIKFELQGSMLQKQIWSELYKIPYGCTKSYGEIARKLKTSPRYVGKVCGQNKHLLVIPCHRVVKSNGELGGFSGLGGIKLKKKLLMIEKQNA